MITPIAPALEKLGQEDEEFKERAWSDGSAENTCFRDWVQFPGPTWLFTAIQSSTPGTVLTLAGTTRGFWCVDTHVSRTHKPGMFKVQGELWQCSKPQLQ